MGKSDVVLSRQRSVAYLMPGQGSQYPRMGAGLYRRDPVFTAGMDAFFAAYGEGGPALREHWLAADPGPHFDDATVAQPLLYAVDLALARVAEAAGVAPTALLGHSVGELAAATVAGVFGAADGARLMAARARAMARTEPGGMLAVKGAAVELRPYLRDGVVVGADNGPRQTILSGPRAPLAAVAAELAAAGFAGQPVRARQAFHAPLVEPAAAEFEAAFAAVELRPPQIPVFSAATGRPVSDAEALRPGFWARQLARPVLFGPALTALLAADRVLIEAGPGGSLLPLARRHPAVRSGSSRAVALLPGPVRDPGQEDGHAAAALDELVAGTAEAVAAGAGR